MRDYPKVIIVGHGEMGKAMEYLLQSKVNEVDVHIWTRHAQQGMMLGTLEAAVSSADIIILCLPVSPYREILNRIKTHIKRDCLIIGLAKGLDENGHTAAQIMSTNLDASYPYALLYGPMISEEIRAGRYAYAQVVCAGQTIYQRIRFLFSNTTLDLVHTDDITGASWAAVLKNVYALLFGMTDELKLGDNVRGYLASACLQELDKIICTQGGKAGTVYQWAGLGDLITTATSPHSHHYDLGRRLARGDNNISGEGVHTLAMIKQHRLLQLANYPIIECVNACVQNPGDTLRNLKKLLG